MYIHTYLESAVVEEGGLSVEGHLPNLGVVDCAAVLSCIVKGTTQFYRVGADCVPKVQHASLSSIDEVF